MMLICVLVLVLWPAGAAAEDDPMWRLANTFNMGDIYNTGRCQQTATCAQCLSVTGCYYVVTIAGLSTAPSLCLPSGTKAPLGYFVRYQVYTGNMCSRYPLDQPTKVAANETTVTSTENPVEIPPSNLLPKSTVTTPTSPSIPKWSTTVAPTSPRTTAVTNIPTTQPPLTTNDTTTIASSTFPSPIVKVLAAVAKETIVTSTTQRPHQEDEETAKVIAKSVNAAALPVAAQGESHLVMYMLLGFVSGVALTTIVLTRPWQRYQLRPALNNLRSYASVLNIGRVQPSQENQRFINGENVVYNNARNSIEMNPIV